MKSNLILILLMLSYIASYSQESYLDTLNYVPRLIRAGCSWNQIADSIQRWQPSKKIELEKIESAIAFEKPHQSSQLVHLRIENCLKAGTKDNLTGLVEDLTKLGPGYTAALIALVRENAATRLIQSSEDPLAPLAYYCVSDIAIKTLEKVSGIYFFSNTVFPKALLSNSSELERFQLYEQIKAWYGAVQGKSKTEAIDYYLRNTPFNQSGSLIQTAVNLAKFGDTLHARNHLRRYFQEQSTSCKPNVYIANIIKALGEDIALETCLHSLYDFRCMPESAYDCVWYILKNAKSDIPYLVLADVVATERYSRFRQDPEKTVSLLIFREMAGIRQIWAIPVLLELMKMENLVGENGVTASEWARLYPQYPLQTWRICDYALLQYWILTNSEGTAPDWDQKDARDTLRKQILLVQKMEK